jgi:hypothetical protein
MPRRAIRYEGSQNYLRILIMLGNAVPYMYFKANRFGGSLFLYIPGNL